jgi:hypothetical protein
MIELICIIIAVATCFSAVYLKRIAAMMANDQKRREEARRVRELEPIRNEKSARQL